MAEKIVLASFEFDTEQIDRAKDANARLKKEIIELRKEQSDTNKAIKESGPVTAAQAASLSKSEAKLKALNKEYQDNIKVVNANASSTDALNKALNEEVKTEQQALNNLQKLTQARKGIDATTKEGAAQITILNKKIDENNKFITENSDKFTQQKRNVGNYTDSIKEALAGQNLFNGSLGGFSSAVSILQPVINSVKASTSELSASYVKFTTTSGEADDTTKSLTSGNMALAVAQKISTSATFLSANAFKILKIAIISTGIGLLVVALGALGAYLSSTQKGIDLVSKVTAQLGAVISVLIDRFAKIGEAIAGVFSGQLSLSEAWKDGKKAAAGVGDEIAREVRLMGELIEAQQKLDKSEQLLAFRRSAANKDIKELNRKVEDTTRSTEDRISAAMEISKIEEEIASKEVDNAKQAIAIALGKQEYDADSAILIYELKEGIIEYQDVLNQLGIKNSTKEDMAEFFELFDNLQKAAAASAELLTTNQNKSNTLNTQFSNEEIKRSDEAIKRISERKDAAITAAKEELDFFQFAFDKKNATVDESLAFEQSVSEQRLAILDKEFSAGKISKTVYELEKLKIAEQLLTANAQLVVDQAAREIAIYDGANKSRIDSNKFLTDEILKEEDIRISALLEKQKEFARLKLEQGVISEQEYNDEVAILDADAQEKKKEVAKLRTEQDIEAQAINLENLIAYRRLVGDSEYELSLEQLERDRLAEIGAAEKNNADVALINKKYEKQKSALSTAENNTRALQAVDTIESVFNAMKSVGLESKGISTGLALVNTYLAISKTLADPKLTFPANALAAVSIGAAGFAQVAKINSVKFADGGGVDGFQTGPSHRQGGMLFGVRNRPNYVGEFEGNEFIVNKNSAIKHRSLLERINSDKFANGGGIVGSIGQSITSSVSQSAMTPEQVLTAIESRIARLEVVNLASETYKVATAEIKVRNEAIR